MPYKSKKRLAYDRAKWEACPLWQRDVKDNLITEKVNRKQKGKRCKQ